jgi:hypothetical protein
VSNSRAQTGTVQPQGIGEDPMTHYTRVFIKFLQLAFASFEKGSYKWTPDPKTTDIIITDQGGVGREVVEKRPAIIVQRGGMQATNVAMDQFAGPTFDSATGAYKTNLNIATGFRSHTDLYAGGMTFNCLSSNGIEAQRLAWICHWAVRTLKRTLMKVKGIHRVGEDISVGPETPPGSYISGDPGEIVAVQVMIPFLFQVSWTVEPLDKTLLTHIDIELRSEVRSAASWKPPSYNGQPLQIVKTVRIT